MMTCPACDTDLDGTEPICPTCGTVLGAYTEEDRQYFGVGSVILPRKITVEEFEFAKKFIAKTDSVGRPVPEELIDRRAALLACFGDRNRLPIL